MRKFKITTGYGYIKDAKGNIVEKCELPTGEHAIKKGYSFVELKNQDSLDLIIVPDATKSKKERYEEKIQLEIRAMAIERLKEKKEI